MCNSVDDSRKHYVEQQNSDTKEYVLYMYVAEIMQHIKLVYSGGNGESLLPEEMGGRGTGKHDKNILHYNVTVGYLGVYTCQNSNYILKIHTFHYM